MRLPEMYGVGRLHVSKNSHFVDTFETSGQLGTIFLYRYKNFLSIFMIYI